MRLALRGPGAETSSASRPNFAFKTVSISLLSSLAGGIARTILPSFFAASRVLSQSGDRRTSPAKARIIFNGTIPNGKNFRGGEFFFKNPPKRRMVLANRKLKTPGGQAG